MEDQIFSSEVDNGIGKATFKWNGMTYELEYRREVDDEENMLFKEIIIEINDKNVHLIPSNLPWSVEDSMEIRVSGMEREALENFIDLLQIVLDDFIEDDGRETVIPGWLFDVNSIFEILLDDWNESVLPETLFNEE
jgi:hypothetical protein